MPVDGQEEVQEECVPPGDRLYGEGRQSLGQESQVACGRLGDGPEFMVVHLILGWDGAGLIPAPIRE
jgi:hypothetical protein